MNPSRWRWRLDKLGKRAASAVCRRLYRDMAGDTPRCTFLAGTARSGTTWLAEVIASQTPCRVMFEPFHPGKVEEIAELETFQFLHPHDRNEPLERFCRRLFSGEIRHPWIDREVRTLRPRRRLIKEIRANLMLRWIHARFPDVRIILLLRHPCAVVASRMNLAWATDTDLDSFIAQNELRSEVPFEVLQRVRHEGSDAAKHAAIWCISYLVPLRQFAAGDVPAIFYEHLVAEPDRELPRLFAAADVELHDSAFQRIHVPSTTSTNHSPVTRGSQDIDAWQRHLSHAEVDDVLSMVDAFGLSSLYGTSAMPLVVDPWGALPAH